VVEAGADFLVGIKGNQGKLEDEEFLCYQTIEKGHGRIETREICVSHNVEWLPRNEQWGFKTLVEVRSERIVDNQVQNGSEVIG